MLTLGAGLATGIGSTIALFAHRTNKRLLSFSLGLSGGVMIYVSFVELFQQAREAIGAIYGPQTGMGITTLAFFGGVLLIGVIDRLVPSVENPHEAHMIEELEKKPKNAKLMRMGLMTALAIGIHNFPEGIATFATAVENPTLGIAHRRRHCHTQHTRRYRGFDPRLLRHRRPDESLPLFAPIGFGRAGRRPARLFYPHAVHVSRHDGLHPGRRRRNHGFHLNRRTAAGRPRIRRSHISIYGVMSGMAIMALSLILLG